VGIPGSDSMVHQDMILICMKKPAKKKRSEEQKLKQLFLYIAETVE
jgi:hypothetical protein